MRTLIVSDIHSNIAALDAVIAAAEREEGVERVVCLGDIVGYGPAPMECVERLRERGAVSIKGNHDAGAVGQISLDEFNGYAADACRWNGEQLTNEAKDWLANLPEMLRDESFLLVHGSPKDPLWDYLVSYGQAVDAWEHSDMSDILVGHTHMQFVCEAGRGIERPGPTGLTVPLTKSRLVANPGSVGQPRDRDPRAAYALYDDDARILYLRRVWYDVAATQRAMAEVGLPDPLITRLSVGM
jgi:predicted phosphodiesterase